MSRPPAAVPPSEPGAPSTTEASGPRRWLPRRRPATVHSDSPSDSRSDRFAWAFGPQGTPPDEGSDDAGRAPARADGDGRFAWAFGHPGPGEPPADRRGSAAPAEAPDQQGTPAASDPTPDASGGAVREGIARWLPRRRVTPSDQQPTLITHPTPRAGDGADPGEAETGPIPAVAARTDAPEREVSGENARETRDGPSAPAPTRRRFGRRPRVETTAQETHPPVDDGEDESRPLPADIGQETNPARLRRRRKSLIDDRELAVYHLGGLAFELYRHDMVQAKVLRHRAAVIASIDEAVHDIDRRLTEIDTQRRERHSAPAGPVEVGCCLGCRTPFAAEARFCWSCGARLHPPDPDLHAQLTTTIRTDTR